MKDEEMARQKAEEIEKNQTLGVYDNEEDLKYDEGYNRGEVAGYEEGFLEGLKAGRPQWHYVKDGDLPKHDHEVLCILWGNTREIGYYKNEVWYFENFSADNEDVDYWQEIIPPKEIE